MNKKDSLKGFSILEVLFAVSILLIGLLGMIFLVTTVISNNKFINRMTTATILLQDKVEELQLVGYNGLASVDKTYTEDYNSILHHPQFKRVTSIKVDYPESRMKMITVTVYWDSNKRYLDIDTIISQ